MDKTRNPLKSYKLIVPKYLIKFISTERENIEQKHKTKHVNCLKRNNFIITMVKTLYCSK